MVDSLQIFEILKAGSLPEFQARAMTLAIQKAESDVALDLKALIAGEFAAAERRFTQQLASLEASLEARVEAKLSETKSEILRWNFAFWVAQLAAMAAILKLLR